jgi:hypothetical protein
LVALSSIPPTGPLSIRAFHPTEVFRFRVSFLFLGAFRIFETLYYQNQQGTGDRALWAAEVVTMKALLNGPGGLEWWGSNPLSFTPEFRAYVDHEVLVRRSAEGAG